MSEWTIEPFAKGHDRTGFSCGKPDLDRFLLQQASQFARKDYGLTFVATRPGDPRVLGYYTFTASSLLAADLPPESARKLPTFPLGTMLLGRLAVDRSVRGQRLGETLLIHSLRHAAQMSKQIALYAVLVHALDDEAAAFYRRYHFTPLADEPRHLFLPMAMIRRLFPPPTTTADASVPAPTDV